MQLIIREYLGLLRESREFDQLLPDLLAAMDIVPTSRPQIGVRQAGVDIAAVGKEENGKGCLYLFVVKRGDIGRKDWDGSDNAVRPSLNQVRDVYLRANVPPAQQDYLKKIVLCTTGDLKQDVQQDWAGYASLETRIGEREYELWNGDRIAQLIEKYLLDEYALPVEARSQFRKALALVAEPEYDLEHYYQMLRRLLLESPGLDAAQAVIAPKKLVKGLNTAHFALSILFRWAESEGNLRNALLAAERSALWGWEALRRNGLMRDKTVLAAYVKLFSTYRGIAATYFNKIQPHCHVKDGLSVSSGEGALIVEKVFEQMGIVALLGIIHLADSPKAEGPAPSEVVANTLIALIKNNKASGAPCYDEHMIEVSLALLLLMFTQRGDDARSWIQDLVKQINMGFQLGKGFPIATDSFDDLVELTVHGGGRNLERLQDLSTLLPALAQWCAIFNEAEAYQVIAGGQEEGKPFAKCCFQLWYPDDKTDEVLYLEPAHREHGTTEAPIRLPASFEGLRTQLVTLTQTAYPMKVESFSCYANGMPFLDLIASRHFRVPVNPNHWQRVLTQVASRAAQTG